SPTRPGMPSRTRPSGRARSTSRPSTAPARVAATSWRSRPTGSSWPTTATPRSRCPKCRCSRSCRAPAGPRGSWTSATAAWITVTAPAASPPNGAPGVQAQGSTFWPLALARELDDLVLHLRTNEAEVGVWVFKTAGRADLVEAYDRLLADHRDDWLVREIRLYWKRTLKRLDVTSRSMFALVEPGSCFVGTLLELALAADRSYM